MGCNTHLQIQRIILRIVTQKADLNTTPILLVEDSEDNVFLVRHALHKAGVTTPLEVVTSGEQAIEYLGGTNGYTDWHQFPLPAIVLLDLKMPGMSGFDVLKWVRQRSGLKALRVAMLTSSDLPSDIKTAHDLGANIFLTKPVELERLVQLMKTLNEHWLKQAQPPSVSRER
jgi:CheY-like chemotaxis protein